MNLRRMGIVFLPFFLSLVACDGEKTPDVSSNQSQDAVYRIVSRPFKGVAGVGDTINLDSYVTLYDADGTKVADQSAYTPRLLTSDLASLSGHDLRIEGEGSITVSLQAGEAKEAFFSLESYGALRKEYHEYVSGIQDTYLLLNKAADGSVGSDPTFHNAHYYFYKQSGQDYYAGLVDLGGNGYLFEMDDLEGASLSIKPGYNGSYKSHQMASLFPLLASKAKSDGDLLRFEKEAAADYVVAGLGYRSAGTMGNGAPYAVSGGTIRFETLGSVRVPLITVEAMNASNGASLGIFSEDYLFSPEAASSYFEEGSLKSLSVGPLENRIEEGYVPEPYKDPGVVSLLEKMNSTHSYSYDYESYFTDQSGKRIAYKDVQYSEGSNDAPATVMLEYFGEEKTKGSFTSDSIHYEIESNAANTALSGGYLEYRDEGADVVLKSTLKLDGKKPVALQEAKESVYEAGTSVWKAASLQSFSLSKSIALFDVSKANYVGKEEGKDVLRFRSLSGMGSFLSELSALYPFDWGLRLSRSGLLTEDQQGNGRTIGDIFSLEVTLDESSKSVSMAFFYPDINSAHQDFHISYLFTLSGGTTR